MTSARSANHRTTAGKLYPRSLGEDMLPTKSLADRGEPARRGQGG
jgi:hypothetical protein